MKAFELRELSDTELVRRIQEEEENLANLRFQKVISQLENPMKLRLTRKGEVVIVRAQFRRKLDSS